jgi:hypothetical protein
MLYSEVTAVCSEIHTKHINTHCSKVEFLMLKLMVHQVNTGSSRVNHIGFEVWVLLLKVEKTGRLNIKINKYE